MKQLTSDQAFLAMYSYLHARYQRTKAHDLGLLLGDMSLLPDGRPADPGVEGDWQAAVQAAVSGSVDATLKLTK